MATEHEIRLSDPDDSDEIVAMYPRAFPDEDLVPLIRSLLPDTVNATSLVAVVDSGIVGHVVFTKCCVANEDAGLSLLGPLGVTPARHGQGIGSALVRAGLNLMRDRGVSAVFVLGDPAFYGRLGFLPEASVSAPFTLPREYDGAWQAQRLTTDGERLSGVLSVPEQWNQEDLWTE